MEEDSARRNLNADAPTPTCVRLFGVQLTDSNHLLAPHEMGTLRKSVSTGNLGSVGFQRVSGCSQPAHVELEGAPYPRLDRAVAHGGLQQGYDSDGLMQSSSMNLRERKKGVPWTEDEHRLFLAGLQELGKGDWRGISRNFVATRTPTQVASHAQKYFLRQRNLNKRKRSSLFDIINASAAFGTNAAGSPSQTSGSAQAEDFQLSLELNLRQPIASSSSPLNKPRCSPIYSKPPSSVPHPICADLCLASSHSERWEVPPEIASSDHASAQDENKVALCSSKNCSAYSGSLAISCQRKSFCTISSPSSSKSASSSSSLCRIDETSELSSLSPSLGLPMPMEASEPAFQLGQRVPSKLSIIPPAKVSEHKEVLLTMGAGTGGAGNASKIPGMSSAIRVV